MNEITPADSNRKDALPLERESPEAPVTGKVRLEAAWGLQKVMKTSPSIKSQKRKTKVMSLNNNTSPGTDN